MIGKRTGNTARGNLLESVLRTKKNESDEDEESFDLMKIARQAINLRNANDRVTQAQSTKKADESKNKQEINAKLKEMLDPAT